MSESALECLRDLFREARDGALPFGCRWESDDRHDAYVAVLRADQVRDYFGQLETVFDGGWEEENSAEAPASVQCVMKSLGGLRSGQYLFAQEVSAEFVGYVALWPWQNGVNVSVRVGVFDLTGGRDRGSSAIEILSASFES